MKFKIEIECDNAAFHADGCQCDDGQTINCQAARAREVRRILNNLAQKLDDDYVAGTVFDLNGNNVGRWGFSK